MSTPIVPATPTTSTTTSAPKPIVTIPTKAAAASAIIVQHHPIIKLIIIAVLIWGAIGQGEKLWSAHEQKMFDSKNAQLASQVQVNEAVAASNAALAQKNIELAAQYRTLLAASQKQIATLITQTKTQQATDATLSPDALANRWQTLINEADSVHPIVTGGYQVTQSGAVATAQALENIPTLNAEVANDGELLSAQTGLLKGDDDQIAGLNTQVKGLQAQTVLDVTTCNAQVYKVKADDAVALHKSRKKWFIAGVITGFVGGLFGGHNGL